MSAPRIYDDSDLIRFTDSSQFLHPDNDLPTWRDRTPTDPLDSGLVPRLPHSIARYATV